MPAFDLAPIQSAIEPYIPLGRSGLLPALHAAQKVYGWLPEEVAAEVARSLRVPLADVHGVIEFYSMFYNEPVGKRIIRVCTDQACSLKTGANRRAGAELLPGPGKHFLSRALAQFVIQRLNFSG